VKRALFFFFFFFFSYIYVWGQGRNSIWCFGDSAGIDFSDTANPVPCFSTVNGRGTCASISDSLGNLLFYAHAGNGINGASTRVRNRNHQTMPNGTGVRGHGWYEEVCIVPVPNNSNQYYLFSVEATMSTQLGVYYSIIDMTLDGGLGAVTLKNIQLQNFQAVACIKAVKHANGRDWWVITRRWDYSNNEFYLFLVTPMGISGPTMQNAGSLSISGLYSINFSNSGNKIVGTSHFMPNMFELFNFNRCSGQIEYVATVNASGSEPFYFNAAFSLSERILYASMTTGSSGTGLLIQYDLLAPDISLSADTVWNLTTYEAGVGFLRLAPDNKIYVATISAVALTNPPSYDSYDVYNNNLSVVNSPDNLGAACNFQPWSFNLGPGRCYWGLPNNAEYDLGPMDGSPCDTLTTTTNQLSTFNFQLSIYPNPTHSNSPITFTYPSTSAKKEIIIYSIHGKEIARYALPQWSSTQTVKLPQMAGGVYVARMVGEGVNANVKFVVE
jgi:hypothetical protein